MASAGTFSDQDKKAFYTVQEEQAGGFSKCLGVCFRMKTKKGLFVWVSTSDTFKNSPNRIFAQRCIPSKKEGKKPLITPGITSEVHSNSGQNGSVSFIKCTGSENKNYLSFGHNNLPDDISAYVFDEEKLLELIFEKNSHIPEDYKLVSSPKTGLKVSRNFDLSRAVGAPVIITNYEPARNQVVGILDVKTDGSLYPVFFKKKTFDLESKGLLRQTDETVESENPITANSSSLEFEDQQAKETNTSASAGTESGDQLGSDNLEATTKNTDKTDSSNGISESAAKGGPITQETEKPKKDKKLSLDDKLEKLWDDPFFQDELCKALDPVHLHSELKDHRHVAHKFDIPPDAQKEIAAIRKVSPSENMFEYLKSTRPDLTIKEFCEKLDMAKAFKPLRSIRSAIEGKVLQNKDLVSQLADKDLSTLKNNLILQLDAQTFWRGLAKQFNIPEKKCSTFLRDPDCNLTRTFFRILNSQSSKLKISKLKTYLKDLEEGKEMLEELSKISGESDLKCLKSEAALMCNVIEPMLNSPQSRLLYKLAEKFKKDGYLRGIDIDEFEATESYESATAKLMEYILTSREEIYKIRDLKDCLVEIERNDCCNIIMKYVEGEAGTENEGHANKENGHKTKTPNAVSETATKETNGDKTDSSVVVSAEAGTENEGHANKENGNKTDIPIAVSETPTKETNGDKTDIPVVVSGINQNKESNESKKTSTTSCFSNNQSIFEAQCIKNKRLGEAPQTALLFNKLKILLDPQKPLGGDYGGLADKFGYTYDEICFFGSQPSPTVALLQEQKHKCTFQTLRKYLNDMGREDAVDKIDEYIKQQGCNCHKCCSIR